MVKAFFKPAPGVRPDEELTRGIQDFLKNTLAGHEYPGEIAYREDFPLTTTGKIRRLKLRLRELKRLRGTSQEQIP